MLTGFSKFLFDKMPPKQRIKIPAEATDAEREALMEELKMERRISKREFTRKKNLFDRMLNEDDPTRRDRQRLAELTMEELTIQFNIVMEKNRNVELNLKEEVRDDYMADIEDSMKETQLMYLRFQIAGEPEEKPKDDSVLKPSRREDGYYSAIGRLTYDVRKVFREKYAGDAKDYASFKINWTELDTNLTELRFSDAQKLMELKKCLTGEALDIVKRLPEEDSQYQKALRIIEANYKDPIKATESVITDLLNSPRMTNTSASIIATYSAMIQAEQTLDGLGVTPEQKGQLLFNVICESKLSTKMFQLWASEKSKRKDETSPLGHTATTEDLLNLLLEQKNLSLRFEQDKKLREAQESKQDKNESSSQYKNHGKKKETLPGSFAIQNSEKGHGKEDKKDCLACKKQGHALLECYKFKNLKTGEACQKFLNESKIKVCRNCLKGPHMTKDCRQNNCAVNNCSMRHHVLLHEYREHRANPVQSNSDSNPRSLSEPQKSSSQDSQALVLATIAKTQKNPILQSCQSWAVSPSGEKFLVRVFLDGGSEVNLIRRELSNQMGLQGPSTPLQLSVAGGGNLPQTMEKKVKFQLQSVDGTYTSKKMGGLTTRKITRDVRKVDVDTTQFDHLKGINFTETYPRPEKEVDILIGVEDFTALMSGPVIRGNPEDPSAIATKLGYVLSGSA
jgi:hypothetical protein